MSQKSAILVFALLVGVMSALSSSRATAASPETPAPTQAGASAAAAAQPSSDEAARRKAWSEEMSRRPLPKKGCFNAKYPSPEWQEVPCGPASRYRNQPQPKGGKPNQVGAGFGDYSANTTGLISSATGSFITVNGASSVSGDAAGTTNVDPNVFMFQINTQFF